MSFVSTEIEGIGRLEGEITLPGDKSISHRIIFLGSLAQDLTKAENFLRCDDCFRTVNAFREMKVDIRLEKNRIEIKGKGLRTLRPPSKELYMGASGTSMRLLLGVLAGQRFKATLTADSSLSQRPMKRVTEPLRKMGAEIQGPGDANFAPLTIEGHDLKPIVYEMPIASAQVKSAILLAGLFAGGKTEVIEPYSSRDHTERLLKLAGAKIEKEGLRSSIEGWPKLKGISLYIPGDISSASFFIVLASILKNSHLIIHSVGLNPTRMGLIEVLKRMGAKINVELRGGADSEPFGDLEIRGTGLKATEIQVQEIPRLIDELPILMVCACFAEGITIIKGASELRVKETDRINSMESNLKRMGAKIQVRSEEILIEGGFPLKGCSVSSFGDHRTAMSMVIVGLLAQGKTKIDDISCINKSFPDFLDILKQILKS